jgi:hypothetical protein
MSEIKYRIHEGKYIELKYPCDDSEMTCLRCGGSHGHTFCEKEGIYSWFCLNPECVEIDSKISKKIVREKALLKLQNEQRRSEMHSAAKAKRNPDLSWIVGSFD